jgi:Tol biopolymer transport system component
VFVLDTVTEQVQQVSEVWVDGPPVWVSNLQLAFTTGLSDPSAAESEIWLANIQAGTARKVSDQAPSLNLSASWSPGGAQVLYQHASDPVSIALKNANGTLVQSTDQFLFSRYGFAAAWSPGGEWVAFAGRNGQCPYGLVVARNNLDIFYTGTTPRACDPSYSPDGRWVAFAGIQTRADAADGRLDLYLADANGYGARNLTSRLQGEVRLLGWVGPTPP